MPYKGIVISHSPEGCVQIVCFIQSKLYIKSVYFHISQRKASHPHGQTMFDSFPCQMTETIRTLLFIRTCFADEIRVVFSHSKPLSYRFSGGEWKLHSFLNWTDREENFNSPGSLVFLLILLVSQFDCR